MKHFIREWKEYVTEAEEDVIGQLGDLDEIDLSFDNIFGDKLRIAYPMQVKDQHLDIFVEKMKEAGFGFSLADGTLNQFFSVEMGDDGKAIKTPIETKDVQQYAKDPSKAPKIIKKTIKIGKYLNRLADISAKYVKVKKESVQIERDFLNAVEDRKKRFPDNPFPDGFMVGLDKELGYSEIQSKLRGIEKKLTDLDPSLPPFTRKSFGRTSEFKLLEDNIELGEWWNKSSKFYRENPDDVAIVDSPYVMVHTRYPIDVMRMSDHDGISSCHSPEGSYFECAVEESMGNAFVSYVVSKEEVEALRERFGLDEDATPQDIFDHAEQSDIEPFADKDRNIEGATPVSRLRFKKLSSPKHGELAVPSTRIYGKRVPGMIDDIQEFAKEAQEDVVKEIIEGGADGLNIEDWKRYGGSYQDTGDHAHNALSNWLGIEVSGSPTHVKASLPSEFRQANRYGFRVDLNELQAIAENTKEQFNRRFDYAECTSVEVIQEDDQAYYVAYECKFFVEIPKEDIEVKLNRGDLSDALSDIEEYIKPSMRYSDTVESFDRENTTVDTNGNLRVALRINTKVLGEDESVYATSVEDLEERLGLLDNIDSESGEMIEEIVKGRLKVAGILEGGAIIKLKDFIQSEHWYEWEVNYDGDEESPDALELTTNQYTNVSDITDNIPLSFDKNSNTVVDIVFDGSAIARATLNEEEQWELTSKEIFETRFQDLEEVVKHVRFEITKLILLGSGKESSRAYMVAVSELLRDTMGGKEGEYKFPSRKVKVSGPDSDDEFKISLTLRVTDEESREVCENVQEILEELDNEDALKELFRKAFARVVKVGTAPATSISESKDKFKKYNFFRRIH